MTINLSCLFISKQISFRIICFRLHIVFYLFSSTYWIRFFQEPLRASISSQLRNSLQNLNIANEILEQAVQLVTNDNLDLGCAVIEQAATDKVSSA